MAGNDSPHRGGEASVLEVQPIDNCSFAQMRQRFSARAGDYRELLKDLRNPASAKSDGLLREVKPSDISGDVIEDFEEKRLAQGIRTASIG